MSCSFRSEGYCCSTVLNRTCFCGGSGIGSKTNERERGNCGTGIGPIADTADSAVAVVERGFVTPVAASCAKSCCWSICCCNKSSCCCCCCCCCCCESKARTEAGSVSIMVKRPKGDWLMRWKDSVLRVCMRVFVGVYAPVWKYMFLVLVVLDSKMKIEMNREQLSRQRQI